MVKPPSSPQRLHRGKDSNNISTHFVFNDDDCYKQGAREGGREGGRTFSVSATRLWNQLPINLKKRRQQLLLSERPFTDII